MEGVIIIAIFGGMAGVAAGLLGAGLWEAFALIAMHAEPTSQQINGLALGGGCGGAALAAMLGVVVVVGFGA